MIYGEQRAWNIGPRKEINEHLPGVHIAKPGMRNTVGAAYLRHFKDKGHLQRAASVVKQYLLEKAAEQGRLKEFLDRLATTPESFRSGKWTERRFREAYAKAGLRDPLPMKRAMNVKPNEALSKQKPRLIFSTGDVRCVTHLFDDGALEKLVFSDPLLESRSIKHADPELLAARVGERARKYDFVASMDFGSFHGSCTSAVCDMVENSIITTLMKDAHLLNEGDGGVWLASTLRDRLKEECKLEAGFGKTVTALSRDVIRESGDRRTSILNYLINTCLLLANISLCMEQSGRSTSEIMGECSKRRSGRGIKQSYWPKVMMACSSSLRRLLTSSSR